MKLLTVFNVLMKFLWVCLMKTNISQAQFMDSVAPMLITPEMHLHNHVFPHPHGATSFPEFGKVVNVTFTFKLLSVVDIEIQNEAIVINANIIQNWINPSVAWNPEYYENITKINVHPNMTWIPDVYIYPIIEDDKRFNGMLSTFNTKIIVDHRGNHSWSGTTTLRMSCTMNVRDYPFDTQVCPLQFGSFTYDSSRINLIAEIAKDYGESSEWHFISMEYTSVKNQRPGSQFPFSDIIYTITMKRKALYPLRLIIMPNLILALLTILVYAVPINSGERVMYIFTIFLAITWYMTSNIESMPNSAQSIPLITYFLGLSIISLALLSICLCYTITCHYADSQIVSMPRWIRLYVLEQFGRYFGIKIDRKRSLWRDRLEEVRRYEVYLPSSKEIFCDNNENEKLENTSFMNNYNPNGPLSSSTDSVRRADMTGVKSGSLWGTNREDISKDVFDKKTLRCLHMQIEKFLCSLEEEDDSRWRQMEWKLVAKTLDQMFFYFFTSVLFLTIFACTIHILKLE